MSIAVDQTRLRSIVETLLPTGSLGHVEATTMLELVRFAAGSDGVDVPAEHSIVQCIAQKISTLSGERLEDVVPTYSMADERSDWLSQLGAQLASREARELTYAFVFLTLVADLELGASEHAALEELQRALGIDDERATDLAVFLTESVAT